MSKDGRLFPSLVPWMTMDPLSCRRKRVGIWGKKRKILMMKKKTRLNLGLINGFEMKRWYYLGLIEKIVESRKIQGMFTIM